MLKWSNPVRTSFHFVKASHQLTTIASTGLATQDLPRLPLDIQREVLRSSVLSHQDLATCCRISRDLLDYVRVQLYRHIKVVCVKICLPDDDGNEEATYRYEYSTNSFQAMYTLFAHAHLGKLVRSLEFTVVETDDERISLISTTRNDTARTFTSLAPGVVSLDFRDYDWPVEEYLPVLSSVASSLEEVSVQDLDENVCEALARSTKLRTLKVDTIDSEVPEDLLATLSASLVEISINSRPQCPPILVNAAAGTIRKVTLPMLSIPVLFQTKLAALVKLTILIEDHSFNELYRTFSSQKLWWTNYKEAESLEIVTLSWSGYDCTALHSEEFLLGLNEGLFCRHLKRINFLGRLPLERLVKSIGMLPATPPVRELGYQGYDDEEMELEIIRSLCNLAGIEFFPMAS